MKTSHSLVPGPTNNRTFHHGELDAASNILTITQPNFTILLHVMMVTVI